MYRILWILLGIIGVLAIIIAVTTYNRHERKLKATSISYHSDLSATPSFKLSFNNEEEAERFRAITRVINEKNMKMSLPQEIKPGLTFEHISMRDNSNMIEAKFRLMDEESQTDLETRSSIEFTQMKQGLCSMLTSLSTVNQAALLHQQTFWRIKFYNKNNQLFRDQDIELKNC